MLTRQQLKDLKSLKNKKYRKLHQLFLAEGPAIAQELLISESFPIQHIVATSEWADRNVDLLKPFQSKLTIVKQKELEQLSQLKTANNVLLVLQLAEIVPFSLKEDAQYALMLDNINDPGNLGTIIRIADWFGIKQIVCSKETVDCFSPKVVQSTMGSLARVQVYYEDLTNIINSNPQIAVYATTLSGSDYKKTKLQQPAFIVIGSEAHGVSSPILALAKAEIMIPRKGKAESLNAAVATGIIISNLF